MWLGPVTTAVQHLVPRNVRATASASFLLINNLIGLGIGPTLIGALSDLFKERLVMRLCAMPRSVWWASISSPPLLMLFAVKRLSRDWVDEVAPAA